MQRGSQPAVHRDAEHRQHRQQQHRHGQDDGDPKPASHASQFRVVLFPIRLDGLRLQGHAALRACSGSVLLDLRVHRTGIDDLLLLGRRTGRFQGHAALRAVPRLVALDFRVHRTDVFAFRRQLRLRNVTIMNIAGRFRVCLRHFRQELLAAMIAAKVNRFIVLLDMASGRFINGHAANGVNCHNVLIYDLRCCSVRTRSPRLNNFTLRSFSVRLLCLRSR